jgi:hypothetical protein
MAYPIVDAPYGLKPVNLIGGQVYAGSTRLLKIASGYAANIFYGDVVKLVATGTVEKDTGTTTGTPVGVFLGCTYTDPSSKQPRWSQYWPTGTVASDAQAYVVDDPDVLFKVAAVSSGTTVAFYAQTLVGLNVSLVQNSGSTTTGDSAVAIDGSSAAVTVSLPIRIIAGVPDTANASGNFCEFICKWNMPYITLAEGAPNVVTWAGGHQYLNPLGV